MCESLRNNLFLVTVVAECNVCTSALHRRIGQRSMAAVDVFDEAITAGVRVGQAGNSVSVQLESAATTKPQKRRQ